MDPFDYQLDPVNPGIFSNPTRMAPLPRNLPEVQLSGQGSGMDPVLGAAIVKGGLDILGGIFGAKGRRRQQDFENRMRQEALNLQRQQFGLTQRQYSDEVARRQALAGFAKQNLEQLGPVDMSRITYTPGTQDYRSMREDNEDRLRSFTTGVPGGRQGRPTQRNM